MKYLLFCVALAVSTSAAAQTEPNANAQNAKQVNTDVIAENEKCFPVKMAQKLIEKTKKIKASKQDSLELIISAKFERINEEVGFPRFYSKTDGRVKDFTVLESGEVLNFNDRLILLEENSELCGEVRTPKGEALKIGLNLGSDIVFKNRTGPYSLAELQDGVADGKSWYKRMFPGPLSIMVPKITHVMVEFKEHKTTTEGLLFTKSGVAIAAPQIDIFGGTLVVSLENIEASGADTLHVLEPNFKMTPVPSIQKMKSLGFGSGEENDD